MALPIGHSWQGKAKFFKTPNNYGNKLFTIVLMFFFCGVKASISTFSFTGNVQSYTVPSSVGFLRIQAYGAQGIIF